MIRFSVVSVFPSIIESYINESILKRAQEKKLVEINAYDLRKWSTDKHKTVDDRIFGGGAGMLLKIEPLYNCLQELKSNSEKEGYKPVTVLTAAYGKSFNQTEAKIIAKSVDNLDYIIFCGRYEGFDARIHQFIDIKYSTGPYILTGGELPALTIVDSVTRLIPNVLGNTDSPLEETEFDVQANKTIVNAEHPQYTSPAKFLINNSDGTTTELNVPEILLSGHHKKIQEYNQSQREIKP